MNETEARTAAGSLVEELRQFIADYEATPTPVTDGETLVVSLLGIAARRERAWQAEVRNERMIADGERLIAERTTAERDALSDFKSYVHTRLDEAGIPADRDDPHSAEGCMIGDRLDLLVGERDSLNEQWAESESILDTVVAERDRLQARITELEHQADERNAGYDVLFRSCEQHRDRADRCEGALVAERRAIGNLLARIFGDGGYRQQAIGDLTAACAEAESVVLADLQALMNLRAGMTALVDAIRAESDDPEYYSYCPGGMLTSAHNDIADRLTALLAASSSGASGAGEEGKQSNGTG